MGASIGINVALVGAHQWGIHKWLMLSPFYLGLSQMLQSLCRVVLLQMSRIEPRRWPPRGRFRISLDGRRLSESWRDHVPHQGQLQMMTKMKTIGRLPVGTPRRPRLQQA